VRIERVTEGSPDVLGAMRSLVPQLSASAVPPAESDVRRILRQRSTFLLVARSEENDIVGMLTLALISIPTGVRAWIEDVVVETSARGSGIGAALVEEALRTAEREGARSVDLTSRPDREAANRLYRRLGFARRETNVYRREFGSSASST
jgi:ribosomal protein S18 acetylase RimI-like enzyme